MSTQSASSTNGRVQSILDAMSGINLESEVSRGQLLAQAQELVEILKNPFQTAFELIFSFAVLPCARIAVDLELFSNLSSGPKSAAQLAHATGADELLIVRIMRVLCSAGICKLLDQDLYGPTELSKVFCVPTLANGLKHTFDMGYRPSAKLPQYFRETGFVNPEDYKNGPFQYAFDTNLDWFSWLEGHPTEALQFNSLMTNFRAAKPDWVDTFPVESVVFGDGKVQNTSPLLVDIGGGYGHDTQIFLRKFPDAKGKVVLQDLPSVIEDVPKDFCSGIELMPHDFFNPQPINAARIYFLKSVLHDWPKNEAIKILKSIATSMQKDYSKLLIVENVIPKTDIPLDTAGLDMILMVAYASLERTEEQWTDLLNTAGLRLVNIWRQPSGDAVMEAQI